MDNKTNPSVVADDLVVSLDYVLTVDGEEVDSSKDSGPIEFIQGYQNIIPGLERELYNMKIGDSKTVVVAPKDGYGEFDSEAIVQVPRTEFPTDIPLEVGVELQVNTDDDNVSSAVISAINNDFITLDFNHPLAGKKLDFKVTVIGLREPSEEELEHGHVHSAFEEDGSDFEYEDFEDDDSEDEEEDQQNLDK